MKIKYNVETEVLEIELEEFEKGAVTKNDLIDALEEKEIEFSEFIINDIVSKLKVNSELTIDIGSYSKEDSNKEDNEDLAYINEKKYDTEEYEESDNEGNVNANTVGNWLAQFVANGYKIQKAQVIRGQVVEEVEFKGDLLIRKQHLCGPQITLLKMIIDEMTSTSSGCNGRVINSIDSFEEENTIYTKLLVDGNITLRYKLIRLETFNNSLKF